MLSRFVPQSIPGTSGLLSARFRDSKAGASSTLHNNLGAGFFRYRIIHTLRACMQYILFPGKGTSHPTQ